MTYCLAIKLQEGLVYCADSRTNAGPDHVSTYSKLHRFKLDNQREMCLLSAGNLGTTQAVVTAIKRDLNENASFNLRTARYVSEVADYVGKLSQEMQKKYVAGGANAGFDATASFIVGGQLEDHDPELFMVYPEGNHITTSREHPYLQIGETKYGKPILERIIRPDTPPEVAMRCALVSMDSTMKSNATVGPPVELLFIPTSTSLTPKQYYSFAANDPYLIELEKAWDDQIRSAFNLLPPMNATPTPDPQ